MSTLLSRVHRGLFFAVAALLMLSMIAPTLAIAQEGGQTADLGTPDSGTDQSSTTDAESVPATTEETPAPVEQGVPWAQPIDYGVVVNNYDFGGLPAEGLAVRVQASPDAQVLGRLWEGQRVEVTSQKFWNGDTPYYTVNFGDGGGYVNANFILLDSEAAPVVTEAPAEVVTEAPTDIPAETVVPTEIVTEAPAETVAPTEAVTEVPAETVAPTEVVTEVPTNVVVPIGTVTIEATTDETEAETPSEAEGTPVPTEPDATTPVESEASATPDVAETATDVTSETPEGAAGTPVVVTETPAETATDVPAETATPNGPDLSKAIGAATVTGTNGEGMRCRVAPDNDAATIVVLAEGTVVQVFDTSTSGWLQIACGGQLGYGDINYLYAGGASDDQINQGGRLTVSGTGGGGVNCRSGAGTNFGVITVISEGTALTIRGQATNGWTPVTCGGQNGYVSSDYIGVSAVTDNGGTAGSSSGTTNVTGTGGDGVRCRTAASTSSSVIMVISEGASVSVRGASSGGWTPVVCGGRNGYISSQYLGAVTQTPVTPTATKTATAAPGGSTGTGWVKVTGAGGGVNCRAGAGTNYNIITLISEGATVQTRSGSTNGWQAVICGGQNGFILGDLTSPTTGGGSGTTPTPTATATATTTPGGGSGTTGSATVANTGGDGVYCRASAPSGNPITVLPEGATVALRGAASNGWQPVICAGQNGFVSSQFLSIGGGGGTTPTATTTPGSGSGSGLANGDHAKIDAAVNLRYDPSTNNAPAMSVQAGVVVLITGAPSNGFYPVDYDGLKGWMIGDVLSKTSDALSKRGGSGNPGTTPVPTTAPGGGGGSATGSAIVNFAMGYLGYPYVWATHGPASFDCSGFTYWVIYNVTGQNIWYGLWTQISAGVPVDRGSLQPGDLVFFQNTYTAGLSHVGIYIGGDQFIHAENEDTGVRISSLSSTYYSSRYYGARRIG